MNELTFKQGSMEWHKARAGIVTGTSLKDAIGSAKVQKTLLYTLMSEMTAQQTYQELTTPAVVRGKDLEETARKAACKAQGKKFETTGMLMSDRFRKFGMSPDAVYRNRSKIVGGLEIKCPNSNNHIRYMVEGGVPKDYWHQVLSPFVLSNDIKWWVFMSFDDRNYQKPEYYYTVRREDILEEITEARVDLEAFLEKLNIEYEKLVF